jgi:uncharacterized protein Yka (UPF0111/DUF47 family)
MKLSLVPREREFFRLFSDMAENLETAAQLLVDLMNDYGEAKSKARLILEHEHVGDKIVHDSIEATADSMILYKVPDVQPQARDLAIVIAKATSVLRKGVDELEKRSKNLRDYWIEVNRLENDGDRLYRDAVAELFDGDMKCTDIIKWKDVYATLEKAVDDCEHVANILESIVLKNT